MHQLRNVISFFAYPPPPTFQIYRKWNTHRCEQYDLVLLSQLFSQIIMYINFIKRKPTQIK